MQHQILSRLPEPSIIATRWYSLKLQCDKDNVRVPAREVRKFVHRVMLKAGYVDENANNLATALTMADYRGVYHLGLTTLARFYYDALMGVCDGKAKPQMLHQTCATSYWNGNNAPGPTTAKHTMEAAIKKAKRVGLGVATAKNCNSVGMASKYVLDAIREKCIAIVLCNGFPSIQVPRSQKAVVGSTSISIGGPGLCTDHFVINMYSSNVPLSKIEYYKWRGLPLPDEWAMSACGRYLHNPEEVLKNPILVPFGGVGLSLALEMLTGILAGGAVGKEHQKFRSHKPPNLSFTCFVIDPTFFACDFHENVQMFMNYLRKLKPIDKKSPVMIPGDLERLHVQDVEDMGGISYNKSQFKLFTKLAEEACVKPLVAA